MFKIAESNMESFSAKFNKLARKAESLGLAIPTFSIVKEEFEEIFAYDEGKAYSKGFVKFAYIEIQNPKVIINGWEFVVAIEHLLINNQYENIVRGHIETNGIYNHVEPICEHCGLTRKRNNTYILIKDNIKMQVGKTCLKDFLGHDAENFCHAMHILHDIEDMAESFSGTFSSANYLDLVVFLGMVSKSISEYGFKPSSFDNSTKNDVIQRFNAKEKVSEEHMEAGLKVLEWVKQTTDESDYMHNLRAIAARGMVSHRHYGYAASMFPAYNKDLIKKSQPAIVSNHVGEVNSRSIFQLTAYKKIYWDSTYGRTYLLMMKDNVGNVFTWRTNNPPDSLSSYKWDELSPKNIILKGTIKAHSDYKGIKQTELTRCTEVELKQFQLGNQVVTAESEKEARKLLKAKKNDVVNLVENNA